MSIARATDRHAPHRALAAIGEAGVARITAAHVGLVGLGGLGCPLAQYLVASGVGRLTLFDFDTVSTSNLARQVLYRDVDVGRAKVAAAIEHLTALNPEVHIEGRELRVDMATLAEQRPAMDLLIDASDNFGTRLACNRAGLALRLPWIMGACVRMEGQVRLFRPDLDEKRACYRCIYDHASRTIEDCQGAGIFAPVAAVVGLTMAGMALQYLAGLKLADELLVYDGRRLQWQAVKPSRASACQDCGRDAVIPS